MLYLALYLRFAGTNTDSVGGTPAGGIVGIVWIYIYAFGWSFGHSVACYVVAAEIFPTRIVSLHASSESLQNAVNRPLAIVLYGDLLLHKLDR